MSEPGRLDRILENAARMQQQGAHDTAMHLLRSALAEEPDSALAHALLGISLLDKKRLFAAEAEARTALSIEPDLVMAHLVLGWVLIGNRKLVEAQRHLQEARALEPTACGPLLALSNIAVIEDRRKDARALLDEARAIEPEDIDVIVALGDLALLEHRLADAIELAEEALESEPDGLASHVLAGRVALKQGRDDDALEHARMALRVDPTSPDAISLLASVRAKKSIVLGLWWRYHASISHLGESRVVLVLLGMFVAVRLLVIALKVMGHEQAAGLAENIWIAWCIYTWVGPGLFRRALDKELESVHLKRDY